VWFKALQSTSAQGNRAFVGIISGAMTMKIVLATFAFAAATVHASDTAAAAATEAEAQLKCDNYGANNGLWKFKPNLEDRWCSTDHGDYATCGSECCEKTDVCTYRFGDFTNTCKDRDGTYDAVKKSGGDDYGYDTSKDKTPWVPKTADVDCCAKKSTCTSANFNCGAATDTVWEKTVHYTAESAANAPRSTNYCKKGSMGIGKVTKHGGSDTCTKLQCCQVKKAHETCKGHYAARTDDDSGKSMMKCPRGYQYDEAVKGSTEVTNDEFWGNKWASTKTAAANSGKCCTATKTCLGEYYRRKYNNKPKPNTNPVQYTDDLEDTDDLFCEVNSYVPKSNEDVAVPEGVAIASWRTTCCVPLKKCSALTCNATLALVANPAMDDKLCREDEIGIGQFDQNGNGIATQGMCNLNDKTNAMGAITGCCKADPKKCRGYPKPSHGHEELACSKLDHEFADTTPYYKFTNKTKLIMGKSNNLVENDGAYRQQCCTKRMRCVVWKDPSQKIPEATASAAKGLAALAAAPVLVAHCILALFS